MYVAGDGALLLCPTVKATFYAVVVVVVIIIVVVFLSVQNW